MHTNCFPIKERDADLNVLRILSDYKYSRIEQVLLDFVGMRRY